MVTVGGCAFAKKLRKKNIFLASYRNDISDIMAEVEHYKYIFTVGYIHAMHPECIPTNFFFSGGRVTGVMFLSRETWPYQKCLKISEDVSKYSQSQSHGLLCHTQSWCNYM